MIIAGILTGGAIIPHKPPSAIIVAVSTIGIPMSNKTGATMLPAVNTDAVEDPVIIPGNIEINISRIKSSHGVLWNRLMIVALSALSVPIS